MGTTHDRTTVASNNTLMAMPNPICTRRGTKQVHGHRWGAETGPNNHRLRGRGPWGNPFVNTYHLDQAHARQHEGARHHGLNMAHGNMHETPSETRKGLYASS